jgi:hypothetical protein
VRAELVVVVVIAHLLCWAEHREFPQRRSTVRELLSEVAATDRRYGYFPEVAGRVATFLRRK